MAKSSNIFIIGFGFGFIALFFLRLKGTMLDEKFIISFTVAAFLLVIADFVEFSVKYLKLLYGVKQLRCIKYLVCLDKMIFFTSYFGAALCMVVLPHAPFFETYTEVELKRVSDSVLLAGLGGTILLIGLKDILR